MGTIINENNVTDSLKIALIKRKLNISTLASIMDVAPTTLYSKFKKGNYSIKDLDDISAALNITYQITFDIQD